MSLSQKRQIMCFQWFLVGLSIKGILGVVNRLIGVVLPLTLCNFLCFPFLPCCFIGNGFFINDVVSKEKKS